MLIDWFTVAAQLVNFLVLVWLLKRFLYKPVLQAIDEREKRIVLQLEEAETQKAEAYKERDTLRLKNDEFDKQRNALMNDAVNEVDTERRRLLDEARQDAEALRLRLQETLRNEHQNLNEEIIRRTRDEVFAIARKVLTDLASTDLETHISEVFIKRLKNLNDEETKQLQTALAPGIDTFIVRSTFDLPVAQQSLIKHTINESVISGANVKFEINPNLISGIELIANGYKITWNIQDYLVSIEDVLIKLLKEKTND
ncbi:MAG: F0F1 ATP synthase subunit B [Bacteroidota bacterium]|nr:F0F1 ATP synthase subunit B [Bacteroidota bacterium]